MHVLNWDFPFAAIWIKNTAFHASENHSSGLMGYSWNSLVSEKSQYIINPIQYWNSCRDNKVRMSPVCSQLCYHIHGCLALEKQVKHFVFQPWCASRKRRHNFREKYHSYLFRFSQIFKKNTAYEPLYFYLAWNKTWCKVVKFQMALRSKFFLTANVGKIRDDMVGNEEKKGAMRVNSGHLVFQIWRFRVLWTIIVLNVFFQNYFYFIVGAMR